MFDDNVICAEISSSTHSEFLLANRLTVEGGSINDTYQLEGQCGRRFFLKLNHISRLEMFLAEAEGLAELADAKVIHIPMSICSGTTDQHAYLVLENIQFSSAGETGDAMLGQQLACLHQHYSKGRGYGWHRDNTIGATPQLNKWSDNWVDFFRQQRLGYQLRLAASNGLNSSIQDKGRLLLDELDFFFEGYSPEASLLHGDLWSGNVGFDTHSQPVIYDPAVYFGDRESDIAMTELFGSFSKKFYIGYEQVWPLDSGYPRRRDLYQLYHILNHFNLFGGGYASQADNIFDKLLICLP